MSLGFNSDVTVAEGVCHVQTEERGAPDYTIETLVYHRGQILHRRTSSYAPGEEELARIFGHPTALRDRVEAQHQEVIEAIRSGAISVPRAEERVASGGANIQIRLLNSKSWRSAGQASLEIEVIHRGGSQPAAGAEIEAFFLSAEAGPNPRFAATADAEGRGSIKFAMPRLGPDGAELVLRARHGNASDEVRYALRPRGKSAPPEPAS